MIVGLPGAGLSTFFYLLLAAIMPVRAFWQVARGRPLAPGQWRLIWRQAAIALGIVAVLAAMGFFLTLVIDVTSGLPAGPAAQPAGPAAQPSSGVTALATSIAALGIVVALVSLGGLLSIIEVLAFLSRRVGTPGAVPPAAGPQVVGRVAEPATVRTAPASPEAPPPRRSGASSRAPVGSARSTGTKN